MKNTKDTSGYDRLHRREEGRIGRPPQRLCPDCFRNGQIGETCPECGAGTVQLGVRARVPRKNASRKKWMEFIRIMWLDRFYPEKEWGTKWKK